MEFGAEEVEGFLQEVIEVAGLEGEGLGADGAEKLGDDSIEARNLLAGDSDRFL